MKSQFARPTAALLFLVALAAYLWLALTPLRWQSPRRLANGAERTAHGWLRFDEPGIARTEKPEPWIESVRTSGRFHLRLRARAIQTSQSGPARLFTVSDGRSLRNFTVGHDRTSLVIRLRHPGTSPNGTPQYRVSKVFKNSDWHTVDINVDPSRLFVIVDGKTLLSESLPPNALADWNPTFLTALGNELTGDRPWIGEISEATLSIGDRRIDYLNDPRLRVPERFWSGLSYRPGRAFAQLLSPDGDWSDAVLNLVGFVALGFLLAIALGPTRSALPLVVLLALLSLLTELVQFLLDTHVPSELDLLFNTTGAVVGVCLARMFGGVVTRSSGAPEIREEARPENAQLESPQQSPASRG